MLQPLSLSCSYMIASKFCTAYSRTLPQSMTTSSANCWIQGNNNVCRARTESVRAEDFRVHALKWTAFYSSGETYSAHCELPYIC